VERLLWQGRVVKPFKFIRIRRNEKSTDMIRAKLDTVMFLNKDHPPVSAAQILKNYRYDLSFLGDNSINKTSTSIQFVVNDFCGRCRKVNLIPAKNFVPESQQSGTLSGEELAELQRSGVKVNVNGEKYQSLSSSLIESRIEFMKKQSELSQQV